MDTLHRVIETQWYGPGVFELVLERKDVDFKPGDCLALYAEDRRTSRPYSIASGTREDRLRFVIRKLDRGIVSSFLSRRRPGDAVRVSPPFGWFHPGPAPDGAPFVFLATGTGIAPFLSHFRTAPQSPPAACLYGVRSVADVVEGAWLRRQCDLRLAVSREQVEGAHHGRVTDVLDAMPFGLGFHYYLCGLDAMIDEVSVWLEAKGTPLTNIHRECFFNAAYAAL